jgi:hypothetical protein
LMQVYAQAKKGSFGRKRRRKVRPVGNKCTDCRCSLLEGLGEYEFEVAHFIASIARRGQVFALDHEIVDANASPVARKCVERGGGSNQTHSWETTDSNELLEKGRLHTGKCLWADHFEVLLVKFGSRDLFCFLKEKQTIYTFPIWKQIDFTS